MFKKILSLFKRKEKVVESARTAIDVVWSIDDLKSISTEDISLPDDFILGNDTCLIIDDNYAQASVIADDTEHVILDKDIKNINILILHSNMAAFDLVKLILKYGSELKIKYVIADLTIGGSVRIKDTIVKLTGVDVIGFLKSIEDDLRLIIYTGNNLNTYIEANAHICKKFDAIMNKDIKDCIIVKRSLTVPERRKEIYKRLFKEGN